MNNTCLRLQDHKVRIFCANCAPRKVSFSKLHPAQLDSELYEPLEIITGYPSKKVSPQNSNIYKGKFGRKGDTAYVFGAKKRLIKSHLAKLKKMIMVL